MEEGLMTCSGNSITGDEVRRSYTSINVEKVGTNRYSLVDGATAAPPANCYGGTSYTDMYESLKFGAAGDCASALGCKDDPLKGQYMIDLTGTDYEIDTGSFISVGGWGHRALVTYDDGDGGVDNSNYRIDIPEGTQKIEATCGGWGGGCWTTLFVRKIYKHVAGNYYTQKDGYPCKESQLIKRRSQCQQAAAAMNREFRDYHDASSKLEGCIWDDNLDFVFYSSSKSLPFDYKDTRFNICSDKGETKDPNSGRCRDVENNVQPQESGLNTPERGWYDVSGCGVCHDYCRYQGTAPCTNGDLTCGNGYWSCALAGTGQLYTPRGTYTGKMATKFDYPKCDYMGQRVNGLAVQLPKVYGALYQLYDGDTWAYDGTMDYILRYSLEGTTSYFRDSLYYGEDKQSIKITDTENFLKGKNVRNTGDYDPHNNGGFAYWMKMIDNYHIRAYRSLDSDYIPVRPYLGLSTGYPTYLRRMFYSSSHGRASYLISTQKGPDRFKREDYDSTSFGFRSNNAFETFHKGEFGALETPFAYCEDGYDGPKPSNIKYASYLPQGTAFTDRFVERAITPTDPGTVYATTLCRHGASLCNDPLAENCTVSEGYWSEYFVPLPEIQNQPFMMMMHKAHFIARWDFKVSNGNFQEDSKLEAMRSGLGTSSLLSEKAYFRVQQTDVGEPSIWEFTFKIAIKGLSSTVAGTEVGYFRVKNKDGGATRGEHVQPIEWGTHVNVQHKWFEMKMYVRSNTGTFSVHCFSDNNADLVFDGVEINKVYPYDWEYNQ
eukprot:CAMPEP_0178960720 /NCGR_PEP_ID=MMETSP0789-20121207/13140_1 /TAXON_ID=3005 /ORGANISM="Rhizosolenia setigera, Strain CCMP 1694" /LENGTH=772 /DNA_ID=CAMNT_0020644139 /DNA_START=212 /DNA_END=2530 /DNA_ORIENTATION=+